MSQYRCYLLDPANHIIHFETAELHSDAEAITWAVGLCDRYPSYHAVELWRLNQKLWYQHCHTAVKRSA